jgi:glycosyltransferase involved in cell wall biosynthesis
LKILLAGHAPLFPTTAGNRQRLLGLLSELTAMGHVVHFCHIAADPGDTVAMQEMLGERFHHFPYDATRLRAPRLRLWNDFLPVRAYNRMMRYLRLPCLDFGFRRIGRRVDDRYDPELSDFLRSLQARHRFEVVIVAYVFFSKALEVFPPAVLRILDTTEKFTGRSRLGEDYLSWWQERRGIRRADRVLAIQHQEAEHFRSMVSAGKVFVVGHIVQRHESRKDHATPTLLFLGSGNDANRDGIQFFLDAIWPRVKADVPEVRLQIAGKAGDSVASSAGVERLGVVTDVPAIMQQAAVVICPLRFGTGLKIKVMEALAAGKAVVATSVGAEGLESGRGRALLVSDDPAEFAKDVVLLLRNRERRQSLRLGALHLIDKLNRENRSQLAAALRR